MVQFYVPPASEFAKWTPDNRPIAVIRFMCSNGHPMSEWWRTPREDHSWGGRTSREDSPLDRVVQQHAVTEESDRGYYERHVLTCPVVGCRYRRVLTEDGFRPVGKMLDLLVAGELPSWVMFEHPSGAGAAAFDSDNLFGHQRGE